MNIVFIIQSLSLGGGVERTLTDKANYLAEAGHRVTMVTYEQGLHPLSFELHPAVSHVDLECRYFTLFRLPLLKRLPKIRALKKLFLARWNQLTDELRPDVIVMTTYSDEFRKEIVSVCKKGYRLIMESHTAFLYDKKPKNILDRFRQAYDLHLIRQCDMVLALSEGDAAFWRRYVADVRVLRNPVSFYIDDPASRAVKGNRRIISAGRLNVPKRYDLLIEAFALIADRYPQWQLDIFGNGPLRDELQHRIDAKGLSGRVVLNKPTPAIYEAYLRSDFLVLCSDYEGLPLVLIEAMACGIPVISTDCPYGPREIIDDGVTGLLSAMDAQALADKMEWMMSHEAEREEMGARAHQAAARYKKDVVMVEWEKAYLSLASRQ